MAKPQSKIRHEEYVTDVGSGILAPFIDGWLLMLLVGVLHLSYGWPGFTLEYWHAVFVAYVFRPLLSTLRYQTRRKGDLA